MRGVKTVKIVNREQLILPGTRSLTPRFSGAGLGRSQRNRFSGLLVSGSAPPIWETAKAVKPAPNSASTPLKRGVNKTFRRVNHSGAWFQAEGLGHTSPGRSPGFRNDLIRMQANGLAHHKMNRAFSARQRSLSDFPRALPWAGMTDAVGVADEAHQPWLIILLITDREDAVPTGHLLPKPF